MSEGVLPWLEERWQGVAERLAQDRLPHALLITGQPGVGKSGFAQTVAAALLCTQRDASGRPCGQCRGCHLRAQGSHPDFSVVQPEENKRIIRVDQVRDLIDFLSLKSQYGGYRVGLIDPADHMNVNAANSILKTLEEPSSGAVLVLVAAEPHRLPATIRSRCQQLPLPVPPRETALSWLREQGEGEVMLELAGGAPLQALAYARDGVGDKYQALLKDLMDLAGGQRAPVDAARQWQGESLNILLSLMLHAVAALIRMRAAGVNASGFRDADRLQTLAKGLDLVALHQYLDRLIEARRYVEHPLNEQLVVEELFIAWRRLVQTGRVANRH